jgi:hypothetical protein
MPLSPTGGDPGVREQDLLGVPSSRSSLVEHECPTAICLPNAPASWNWNSGASDGSTNAAASPCRDRDGPRARSLVQSPRRLLMRGAGRPRAGSPPATRSRTVPPAGPGAIGCPPVSLSQSEPPRAAVDATRARSSSCDCDHRRAPVRPGRPSGLLNYSRA